MSIRVLVVDDDPLVRSALTLMLSNSDDIVVVGEAVNGRDCLAVVPTLAPTVVLMDLRMPVMGGTTAIARLTQTHPEIAAIALTTFDTDDMALGAISAGAAGFLLKDTPPPDLVAAIRRVAAGEPILAPTALQALLHHVRDPEQFDRRERARTLLVGLADRERQVAMAIAEGRSNTEIAAELHLSLPTIKTYVSRVLDRCNLTNRTQIALLVQQADLAPER